MLKTENVVKFLRVTDSELLATMKIIGCEIEPGSTVVQVAKLTWPEAVKSSREFGIMMTFALDSDGGLRVVESDFGICYPSGTYQFDELDRVYFPVNCGQVWGRSSDALDEEGRFGTVYLIQSPDVLHPEGVVTLFAFDAPEAQRRMSLKIQEIFAESKLLNELREQVPDLAVIAPWAIEEDRQKAMEVASKVLPPNSEYGHEEEYFSITQTDTVLLAFSILAHRHFDQQFHALKVAGKDMVKLDDIELHTLIHGRFKEIRAWAAEGILESLPGLSEAKHVKLRRSYWMRKDRDLALLMDMLYRHVSDELEVLGYPPPDSTSEVRAFHVEHPDMLWKNRFSQDVREKREALEMLFGLLLQVGAAISPDHIDLELAEHLRSVRHALDEEVLRRSEGAISGPMNSSTGLPAWWRDHDASIEQLKHLY